MAKQYGLNSKDFESANLMSFGKSFSRLNGQPLDKSEVWYDNLQALKDYALTDAAYVGQKVFHVDTVNKTVVHYSIELDGSLKELGKSVAGDEKTITVNVDGTVSLYGIDGLELERTVEDEDGETSVVKINYQPLLVDGKLTWVEPSATTVEGLATEIEGLKSRLSSLEKTVEDIAIPDVPVTNVSGDGKIISVVPTDGDYKVSATLGLSYIPATSDSNAKLQLVGINDEEGNPQVIGEIDASDFILDGMVETAKIEKKDDNKTYLILTLNTAGGSKTVEADVSTLIDVYTKGNGIDITDNKISILIDSANSEGFLSVDTNGLKITGVQNAIDTAVQNAVIDLNEKDVEQDQRLTTLESKPHLSVSDVDEQIVAKLTDYSTTIEVNEIIDTSLAEYLKTEDIQSTYATKEELNQKLSITDFDLAIANYVTQEQLEESLSDKVTTDDLNATLADYLTIANASSTYVSSVGLAEQLSGYLTAENAEATYVKKTDTINVNQLEQTDGDILILHGGDASTGIND